MGLSSSDRLEVPADLGLTRGRIIGSQQNGREFLYEALDYAAKGKVKVIEETYSLKEIGRAYERVANGQVRFRVVITN
jgi:D-arabinose 1-dehydrogenase-like Zn-dependent alcohol dehydrogenase